MSRLPTFLALLSSLNALADLISPPFTNPANGHKYYLLDATNWDASEAQAREIGGHLTTIDDAAENRWVLETFSTYGGVARNLWIGLRHGDEIFDDFFWIDGSPFRYANWARGEPNGFFERETSVMMYPLGSTQEGKWNDGVYDRRCFGVVEIVPEVLD